MARRREEDQPAGFSAPLDPTGRAALYGPPPWRFCGRSLTVVAECDSQAVAGLLPQPLVSAAGSFVRFSVHDLLCDLGFGWDFAQRHPERSHFREAVIGISAEHDGRPGFYDPFLWCDSDAEIAVGREMFGWPQVAADLWLTPPHSQRETQPGDFVAAKVARLGRPVFDLELEVEGPGDLPAEVPAFVTFYTMRVLPDPTGGPTLSEVYASDMNDVSVQDCFTGKALLQVHAPELKALHPGRIVGARSNSVAWTKGQATLIGRSEVRR